MQILFRAGLLLASLAAFVLSPHTSHATTFRLHFLSPRDQNVAHFASHLALHDQRAAIRWLRRQTDVTSARLTPGGGAIKVVFRDGLPLLLIAPSALHPGTQHTRFTEIRHAQLASVATDPATSGKAAVLLPFATALGEDANAAQTEIDTLKRAGFSVDVFRDADVTISLMEHLTDYSVIYLETHSDPLGDGDAVVSTASNASTDSKKYCAFLLPAYCRGGDGTIQPVNVDGTTQEYLAIGAGFVQKHMGTFPNSSILYLDGCNLLGAQVFWQALQGKNLGTMLSWDNHVYSYSSEEAARYMFGRLDAGLTVQASLDAANAVGVSIGYGDLGITHLGYLGDGADTLAKAHDEATPTPSPTDAPTTTPTTTPVPTATPAPLFLRAKLAHKTVKVGGKQTVSVSTLPSAHVAIQVQFPNHGKKHHSGSAGTSGAFSWTFKQPGGVTTAHNATAKVVVKASDGLDAPLTSSRTYKIR